MSGRPPSRAPTDAGGVGVLLVAVAVATGSLVCWLLGGIAGVLTGRGWHEIGLASSPGLLVRLLSHPGDPRDAWPRGLRHLLPPGRLPYAGGLVLLAAAVALGALGLRRVSHRSEKLRPSKRPAEAARWASRTELGRLAVPRPGGGRVVVGRASGRLLAVEAGHSLLVVGPTQSGKTSGLAIPAILEWDGPVVATSVKTDLVRATGEARQSLGPVLVYDPTEVSGRPGAGWSPLAAAGSWSGARQVAASLCSVARAGVGGMEDAGFWYATAEKLLAPLLFAAATSHAQMEDLVRWVDTEEVSEVLVALERAGEPAALQAAGASFAREDRQRSSVYATAETVLAAWADPAVARSAARCDIDPAAFVTGGEWGTCYLVAPAHEQDRLQAAFVALLRSFLDAAFTEASRAARPLDPPLLVVLDEAANVAPLAGLDAVAATAASHGIQLVTLWQDLAQLEARYGPKAATVINNHRAKLVCSGVADPSTLDQVSRLIGEEEHWSDSTSIESSGRHTRTRSSALRRLAPGDALRRLQPGQAVLLYGHLPPIKLVLRPFYRLSPGERRLRRRGRERTGRRQQRPRVSSRGSANA
ncbi:MAG: type secretory system conjugative transfer family protein [Acidimicrobiaceae bacterium]|nr:type secretory system conjugative transfer family protein [Acidimicrobiaceae bacterium]